MKKVVSILAVVLILHYGTLLLFGQYSLTVQLKQDTNSTYDEYKWTRNIYVVGNLGYLEKVSDVFHRFNADVTVIERANFELMDDIVSKKDTYKYFLFVDSRYSPHIKVEEYKNIGDYAAFWKREYIWCFFFWIKIRDEMTGIS